MQKVKLSDLSAKPKAATATNAVAENTGGIKIRKAVDVLLAWEAAERIWKPKNRMWYLKYALLMLVLIFVAVRMGYYIVIIALCAFLVLWFLQGGLVPWVLKHKLTTKGIFTNNVMIPWKELRCFWFAQKEDQILLYLDFDKDKETPRLTLLVPQGLDQEIYEICAHYLIYGDLDMVEYNLFTQMIYGKYIPLTNYVPDLDDQEYLESKKK